MALVVVLAACADQGSEAGGVPSPTTSTATSAVAPTTVEARCGGRAVPDADSVFVDSPSGERLWAIGAGSGRRGLVLIYAGTAAAACNWGITIAWLAAEGFHVLAYDRWCSGASTCRAEPRPLDDVRAAVDHLRAAGASHVVVVGAWAGAADAIMAAALPVPGVDAAVTLSAFSIRNVYAAEDVTYTSQLEAAAHISIPILYTSEPNDPTATPEVTRSLQEAAPPGLAEIAFAPPGAGHDVTMLYADGTLTEQSLFAETTLLDYLRAQTGG